MSHPYKKPKGVVQDVEVANTSHVKKGVLSIGDKVGVFPDDSGMSEGQQWGNSMETGQKVTDYGTMHDTTVNTHMTSNNFSHGNDCENLPVSISEPSYDVKYDHKSKNMTTDKSRKSKFEIKNLKSRVGFSRGRNKLRTAFSTSDADQLENNCDTQETKDSCISDRHGAKKRAPLRKMATIHGGDVFISGDISNTWSFSNTYSDFACNSPANDNNEYVSEIEDRIVSNSNSGAREYVQGM